MQNIVSGADVLTPGWSTTSDALEARPTTRDGEQIGWTGDRVRPRIAGAASLLWLSFLRLSGHAGVRDLLSPH
ncbi:hypothetical protein Tdes44962_MAKER05262 [Teratosphaeria destructans]|uniref:Uncharacterized protein n=1 Tax=Teratosphaeria destructans TaxID=418781 RepID=A0A9W7SK96_9PEZI|nr:hypothetical protein Tdes44962_MAKER05262 [Teratosphaeria destructans]